MKHLPTVYLDTSLLSALHYRGGSVEGIHRQVATRAWWDAERSHFRLLASVVVEDELREGRYGAQAAALAEVVRLPYLPVTKAVQDYAAWCVRQGLIPIAKRADALQLALASVHEIDYLLTWNYAHLANAATQARLAAVNQDRGMWVPWLVSPETIPKRALGQDIRRRR